MNTSKKEKKKASCLFVPPTKLTDRNQIRFGNRFEKEQKKERKKNKMKL
jgi:hypothetical protein